MPPRAIFRRDNHWVSLDNPAVLVAMRPPDVVPLLEEVEAAAAAGSWAAGFIAFEAASAFDPALVHHAPAGGEPLAMFVIGRHLSDARLAEPVPGISLSADIRQPDYEEKIRRIMGYLQAGDTYQVNFTHRYTGHIEGAAESVFSRLSQAQPSPYAMFLRHGDFSISSVSPELFFEKDGHRIRCEPMKGTRPRGRYPAEDVAIRESLLASGKDRAENLMIVDMIRNDLGRIARTGTVTADDLFMVRRFPTVWQQVSQVTAETDAGLSDIFGALFPCASVTGAPKARTMQIIAELEDSPRGVYTGALGVLAPGGQATFSVGIRTLTQQSGHATYGVGGGIVWDSIAAEEWQEARTKAQVLDYRLPGFDLVETMLVETGGVIPGLDRHLARLKASAEYFGYPFDEAGLRDTLDSRNDEMRRAMRMRLRRDGSFVFDYRPVPEPAVPVKLRLAAEPVSSDDVFLFHKTTHREVYDQAIAAVADCDDVLLWNERGELTETSICNIILEMDGTWYTPPLSSGLLAGTRREALLAQGRVEEKVLLKEDLLKASKVYVCNSLRGVLPAVVVNTDCLQGAGCAPDQ